MKVDQLLFADARVEDVSFLTTTRVAGPNQTARDLMSNRPEKALSENVWFDIHEWFAFRFQIIHLWFLGSIFWVILTCCLVLPWNHRQQSRLDMRRGWSILKMFIQDFAFWSPGLLFKNTVKVKIDGSQIPNGRLVSERVNINQYLKSRDCAACTFQLL